MNSLKSLLKIARKLTSKPLFGSTAGLLSGFDLPIKNIQWDV